jgi:hypothetical protein
MLKSDTQTYRCLAKDLSNNGMLVVGLPEIGVGATFELVTYVPGRSSLLRCSAMVVRADTGPNDSALAVTLSNFSQEDRDCLNAYLSGCHELESSTEQTSGTCSAASKPDRHRQDRVWRAASPRPKPQAQERKSPAGPTEQSLSTSAYPSQFLNDPILRGN